MSVFSTIKKYTTIKTKAILLLYVIVMVFSYVTSLIEFSLVRFIKSGLGSHPFIIIGTIIAVANAVVVVLDIPMGIVQKYIRPRKLIIWATVLLLISNLIFLLATLSFWMSLLAILFYTVGNQLFFITVITYILKLSSPTDFSENIAQGDIADRIGSLFGFGLGGLFFIIDNFLDFHHAFVASILVLVTFLLLLVVYEFMDRDNYSEIEKAILEQSIMKNLQKGATSIAEEVIVPENNEPNIAQMPMTPQDKTLIDAEQAPESAAAAAQAPAAEDNSKKLTMKVLWTSTKETFMDLLSIITNPGTTKILLWGLFILIFTNVWYNVLTFFAPVFLKDIFQEGKGFIQENISPYLYQSVMLILAIFIPTFFLELPLSKLADKWGKQKMIILGMFICAISLIIVAFIPGVITFFLIFLSLSIGFTIIYPPLTGLIGEEMERFFSLPLEKNIPAPASAPADASTAATAVMSNTVPQGMGPAPTTPAEKKDLAGESASIIAIFTNIGVILAGILGGTLLEIFDFNTVFLIFGVFILVFAVPSFFFMKSLMR